MNPKIEKRYRAAGMGVKIDRIVAARLKVHVNRVFRMRKSLGIPAAPRPPSLEIRLQKHVDVGLGVVSDTVVGKKFGVTGARVQQVRTMLGIAPRGAGAPTKHTRAALLAAIDGARCMAEVASRLGMRRLSNVGAAMRRQGLSDRIPVFDRVKRCSKCFEPKKNHVCRQ